jgi:hypothetical protein
MTFRSDAEKVLYWIYRTPHLYPGNLYVQEKTVKVMMDEISFAPEMVAGQDRKDVQDTFRLLCEYTPENYLRYFQEMECLRCDLCAGLRNVFLFDMTPRQAVNKLRKGRKAIEPK